MSDSVYANPRPYDSINLERNNLTGRIKVARGIASRARESGDIRTAEKWEANVDTLLDHLSALEERAVSAGMDRFAEGTERSDPEGEQR